MRPIALPRSRWIAAIVIASLMLIPLVPIVQPAGAIPSKPPDLLKSCLQGGAILPPVPLRIALVEPVFTETPYANFDSSFYAFYTKHRADAGVIKSDFDMLKTSVVSGWPPSVYNPEPPLYEFLTSKSASNCGVVLGKNLNIINDIDVNNGALFSLTKPPLVSTREYDVIILGHEEYVTSTEYEQFRQFVGSGGYIVEMSGNTFWAQVDYSPSTNVETFVVGHGFQFDGSKAWRTRAEPFDASSSSWFGSVFDLHQTYNIPGARVDNSSLIGSSLLGAFGKEAFTKYTYTHNEVNYVTNFTGTQVIARFHDFAGTPIHTVDAYIHSYRAGYVVCLCIYGENFIKRDTSAQYFLLAAIRFALSADQAVGPSAPPTFSVHNGSRGVLVTVTNYGLVAQRATASVVWKVIWQSHIITLGTKSNELWIGPSETRAIFVQLNSIGLLPDSLYTMSEEPPLGSQVGNVLVYQGQRLVRTIPFSLSIWGAR